MILHVYQLLINYKWYINEVFAFRFFYEWLLYLFVRAFNLWCRNDTTEVEIE